MMHYDLPLAVVLHTRGMQLTRLLRHSPKASAKSRPLSSAEDPGQRYTSGHQLLPGDKKFARTVTIYMYI